MISITSSFSTKNYWVMRPFEKKHISCTRIYWTFGFSRLPQTLYFFLINMIFFTMDYFWHFYSKWNSIWSKIWQCVEEKEKALNIFIANIRTVVYAGGGGGSPHSFMAPYMRSSNLYIFSKSKSSKYKFNRNWNLLTQYTVSEPTVNIRWHCKFST